MLTTLIKLGSQLSHNRGEWDDIIDYPNIQKEKDKNIKLYVAELIFDLDKSDVYLNPSLKEYDEEQSCLAFKNIKIQGGNNKAIYACVESGKLEQVRKTFFGVIDSKGNVPSTGQFQEAITKDFPQFNDTLLGKILPKIFSLSNIFIEKFTIEKESKGQTERLIDEKLLTSSILQSPSSKIILFYTSVLSSDDNINTSTAISKIEGFEEFMKAKFLEKGKKQTSIEVSKKLCYATGTLSSSVTEVNFADRYSLNKMFVKETKNYASFFDKNSFVLNYQVSNNNQLLLSRASKYLLENQKIRIAGIDHCIIPQFLNKEQVDIQYITKGIFQKSELLFDSNSFDNLVTSAEYETDAPFWITFLAFESDGNFFKTINEIKDVSKFHFYKIIDAFNEVNDLFKNNLSDSVDWLSVMTDYGKQHRFNLASIYSIIPIRKDKEKKNEVLSLFKLMFENRKIDPDKLFKHFCDLILCHRYKRYEAFKNVKKYEDKHFDFAIRDSVFKYFALIQALKQLNLLQNMEEIEIVVPELSEDSTNEYQQKINTFFQQMSYRADQKAMFYLGRMLSSVAYIQKDKSKNVLEKVNFSGMDKAQILRLRNSLMEKAKQYKEVSKVIFADSEFNSYFDFNNWNMKPEEAVFFILSGYSFGIVKSSDNK
ncbi:TM1802 family CRISPR-associated protein [Cellulophaga sp. BC115SP]|uniref:TM1802 family CRISPR-associated protein n=1 Tax=Cellulophaga sp. BC115SP TaxID=2683263 RepID=UPI00141260DB|nr:TM1802 family CRISPR-associated protein [Cellulophaga sp. BC115SP]NBB31231.1 hypothetical protein [Cellulophaga sp. BC115SP]